MSKTLLVVGITRLMKIIHVQLPHKTAEIVVFKVFWQNKLRKRIRIFDDKAVTLLVPKHGVSVH